MSNVWQKKGEFAVVTGVIMFLLHGGARNSEAGRRENKKHQVHLVEALGNHAMFSRVMLCEPIRFCQKYMRLVERRKATKLSAHVYILDKRRIASFDVVGEIIPY